jgi:hypothetical protein
MQSALSWPRLAMALDEKHRDRVQPDTAVSRDSAQRASAAQALLVARLKARNRRDLAVDTLERGAHVMWVTCKSWFSSGQPPASAQDEENGNNNDNKDTDAHRDH